MKKKIISLVIMILCTVIICEFGGNTAVVFADESITFGNVIIDNPTGKTAIEYEVQKEIKTSDTVAFNIDFNTSDAVSVSVLANGLIKCFEQEYETWQGKNTLSFVAKQDMRYFTIYVDYHGMNLSERVCEISNIRLTQADTVGEAAIHTETEEQDEADTKKHDTSGYAIAGLVLMGVAVALAVACGITLIVRTRKK